MTEPHDPSDTGEAGPAPGRGGLVSGPGEAPRRWELALSALVALGLFAALAARGVRFCGDSMNYIEGEVFRPPVYVWLVRLYNLLFNDPATHAEPSAYLGLSLLQILFGFLAGWVLCATLRRLFRLDYWLAGLLWAVLLSPYFFGDYIIGNTIQTEGITYPLYLIGFAVLIRALVARELGGLFLFLGLLFLLVLTRKQFVFVFPAFLVILLYVLWAFEARLRAKLVLLGCFLAVVLGSALAERAYLYATTGHFAAAPFTGIQLVAAPLYLSAEGDEALFADQPETQALLRSVRATLKARQADYESVTGKRVPVNHYFNHYSGSYNIIVWNTVVKQLRARGVADWFEIDRITKQIAWRLIERRPLAFLKLYFHNVKFALGGYYPMLATGFVFLLSLLFAATRQTPLALTLAAALLLHLANFCTIALVETINRRYSIYTETVFVVLVMMSFHLLLRSHGSGSPLRLPWRARNAPPA